MWLASCEIRFCLMIIFKIFLSEAILIYIFRVASPKENIFANLHHMHCRPWAWISGVVLIALVSKVHLFCTVLVALRCLNPILWIPCLPSTAQNLKVTLRDELLKLMLISLIISFCYVLWGSQEVRKFQADSTSSHAGSPWCYQPETS